MGGGKVGRKKWSLRPSATTINVWNMPKFLEFMPDYEAIAN